MPEHPLVRTYNAEPPFFPLPSGRGTEGEGMLSPAYNLNRFTTMTPQTVLEFVQRAMEVGLLVAAPMLLAALVTGLVISVLQAATQINEMTLSFIPKLVALFAVLVVAGPWMLSLIVDYLRDTLTNIPNMIG